MRYCIQCLEPAPRLCFNGSNMVFNDAFYLSFKGGTLIWRMSKMSAWLYSKEEADNLVTWLTAMFPGCTYSSVQSTRQETPEPAKRVAAQPEAVVITADDFLADL